MCRARLPVPLSSLEGSGICEPSLNIRLTCFMWSAMAQTTPFEVFRSKPYVILPVFGSICSSALGKTSRTSFRKHIAISRASRLYEAKKASSWLHMAVLWRNIVGSVLKCTFVVVSPRGFGVCFSRGVLRFSSARAFLEYKFETAPVGHRRSFKLDRCTEGYEDLCLLLLANWQHEALSRRHI